MSYRVHVRVMPRAALLDPQGQAVEHALTMLGFQGVGRTRVGRAIELELAADSPDAAALKAREICDRLLANPVTEDYQIDVEGA